MAIKAKIYKKVAASGDNQYVLYYPETEAEQVIYSYTSLASVANVKQALDAIFSEIDAISGVLEFKGNANVNGEHGLPTDGNRKGEVYVVQYPTGTGHHIYWSTSNSGPWEEYPTNTLFVCSGDTDKNYIKDETDAAAKVGWIPLGGTNSAYATKTEAIHTIVGDNTGLKFGYASEANATHSVEGVSTIGTTAVNTLSIVSTIPSTGADSSLPNVAAVRAFAGSADNVIVATTSSSASYYITFVSNTGSAGQPLYVDSDHLTYNPSTNVLNVTASQASTATIAGKVSNTFTVAGQAFDGSAAKTVAIGNGLTTATNGTTTTISVNAVTGGAVAVTSSGIDLTQPTTIAANAVYSAIQVDAYGRAKAGAQSIIFAQGLNDPDLGDLVVGGLAFIGTSTAAASTYTSHTAASSESIGVMDDAE